MNINTKGSVGLVYTTQAGFTSYSLDYDEGEGKEGWLQINKEERQFVVRKRMSHQCVMWVAPEEGEVKPMSHKEDGALF